MAVKCWNVGLRGRGLRDEGGVYGLEEWESNVQSG